MSDIAWREQQGGDFIAEMTGSCLRVSRTPGRHHVRFLIEATDPSGAPMVIGSGTMESIGEAMQAAERMATRFGISPKPKSPFVIVADDDEDTGAIVTDILREEGFDVVLAASGEGALRRIERAKRRIMLVTDMHLGRGMNGMELAAAARELSPNMGFVLMSGDLVGDLVPRPDAFLAKPFSTARLLSAVAVAESWCNAHTAEAPYQRPSRRERSSTKPLRQRSYRLHTGAVLTAFGIVR